MTDEFRRWWADHQMSRKPHGTVHLHQPAVGKLSLTFDALKVPDAPDQTLITFTAAPGAADETALRLLASWSADSAPGNERQPADH